MNPCDRRVVGAVEHRDQAAIGPSITLRRSEVELPAPARAAVAEIEATARDEVIARLASPFVESAIGYGAATAEGKLATLAMLGRTPPSSVATL